MGREAREDEGGGKGDIKDYIGSIAFVQFGDWCNNLFIGVRFYRFFLLI